MRRLRAGLQVSPQMRQPAVCVVEAPRVKMKRHLRELGAALGYLAEREFIHPFHRVHARGACAHEIEQRLGIVEGYFHGQVSVSFRVSCW